jgi:hypothetical protein
MPVVDFRTSAYGLTSAKHAAINDLVRAYNPRLSLRRIPTSDPAFTPQKPYGVFEEGVDPRTTPWVFTLAEMSIDERVVARLYENDFARAGASEQHAKMLALRAAQETAALREEAERDADRREEMIAIGRLADKRSQFRHRFADGTTQIIGGDAQARSGRSYV